MLTRGKHFYFILFEIFDQKLRDMLKLQQVFICMLLVHLSYQKNLKIYIYLIYIRTCKKKETCVDDILDFM